MRRKGEGKMFQFMLLQNVIRLLLGLVTSLRSLVSLAIIGSICYFGYQVYQHDFDVLAAFAVVKHHYVDTYASVKATVLDLKGRLTDKS